MVGIIYAEHNSIHDAIFSEQKMASEQKNKKWL